MNCDREEKQPLCGIGGIIYRNPKRQSQLGLDLLTLIQPLESRGPDSCGVALYGNPVTAQQVKLVLSTETEGWQAFQQWLAGFVQVIQFEPISKTKGCATVQWQGQPLSLAAFKATLAQEFPQVHLVSLGQQLEIYKQVGTVADLFQTYCLRDFGGSHGIGHTRMATESVVDTEHCHPFTSTQDLAIVHNGQVSNYYKLRFTLERQGMVFETDNDSEAIAHYLHHQLRQGNSLEAALHAVLQDIDGTYTLLVATANTVGLVRDKFAAKPAVIYESPDYVAIASEFRCLVDLPNFDPRATIREPDAAEVNIWSTTPTLKIPAIAAVG